LAAWAPDNKKAVAQNATARVRRLETRWRRASGMYKISSGRNKDRSVTKSKKARNISYLHPFLHSNTKDRPKT